MKMIKFYAEWCQPCKILSRVIQDAGDKIDIAIEDIDIDQNMEVAKQYNVRGVPMLVIVDDTGATIRSRSGAMNEQALLTFIKGE
jgi:thioredoxin 1